MLIIWGKKMGSIIQKKSREKMEMLRNPQNLKNDSNTFENITNYLDVPGLLLHGKIALLLPQSE